MTQSPNQDPEYLELLNHLRQNSQVNSEKEQIEKTLSEKLLHKPVVIPNNEPVLKQILEWLKQAANKGYSGINVKLKHGFSYWNSIWTLEEEKRDLPLYQEHKILDSLEKLGLDIIGGGSLNKGESIVTIYAGHRSVRSIYSNPDNETGEFTLDSLKLKKITEGQEIYQLFKKISQHIIANYDGFNLGLTFKIPQEFISEIMKNLKDIPPMYLLRKIIKFL